jgi:type III secretion protein T
VAQPVSPQLFVELRQASILLALCTTRILVAVQVVPFAGGQVLSGTVRNGVVLSLGLILFPVVHETLGGAALGLMSMLAIVAKEVVLGLLIGFLSGLAFWAAACIGYLIDNQRGATLASVFDPLVGEQTSPLGEMLQLTVTALFYASGGFHLFLGFLYESYKVWPVGAYTPHFGPEFPAFLLEQCDRMLRVCVVLAAPVVITVFVSEFGLGLVSRFAPQLNVFALSMPVKSAVAGVVLVLYLPFLLFFVQGEIGSNSKVLRLLAGLLQ